MPRVRKNVSCSRWQTKKIGVMSKMCQGDGTKAFCTIRWTNKRWVGECTRYTKTARGGWRKGATDGISAKTEAEAKRQANESARERATQTHGVYK